MGRALPAPPPPPSPGRVRRRGAAGWSARIRNDTLEACRGQPSGLRLRVLERVRVAHAANDFQRVKGGTLDSRVSNVFLPTPSSCLSHEFFQPEIGGVRPPLFGETQAAHEVGRFLIGALRRPFPSEDFTLPPGDIYDVSAAFSSLHLSSTRAPLNSRAWPIARRGDNALATAY